MDPPQAGQRSGAEVRWMEDQQTSYAYFPVAGTFEWIFLEDVRSFRARLALIEELRLRGFSAWVPGPEDPAIWDTLAAGPAR